MPDIENLERPQNEHEYDGSQIQVLEGLEAVRKRPGMYIGSTGPRGLHHLVYEIVDNSIDEALAGYCNHIEVTIKKDNILEVNDNGRGIPVDIQPKLGIPAVTVVFTVLHAGGKFGGDNSGYKVSGGLHGVGASVVNALSEWLEVRVRRDGSEYRQTFKRGVADGPLEKIGPADTTGTTVRFKADPEMFTETTVYDYDTLLTRLREEAFLNAGVRITLTDERPDPNREEPVRQESMCYEGGIRSFVEYLQKKRENEVLHPQVIYLKGQIENAQAEVAMQYSSSYNELILSFANNVHTPDGGTHEEGLGGMLGLLLPLGVVLFILIILHPYAPKVLNNVGFAYLTVACIDSATFAANLPLFFGVYIVGSLVFNGGCVLLMKPARYLAARSVKNDVKADA